MASSSSSPRVPSPKTPNKVRNLFGKLLPSLSSPGQLESSTSSAPIKPVSRRRSTESFFSGLPDGQTLTDAHHTGGLLPSPIALNFDLSIPARPTRPTFGASSSPLPVSITPNGFQYAPLTTVSGRVLGLRDFGPVVDAGPAQIVSPKKNKTAKRPQTAPAMGRVREEPLSYGEALKLMVMTEAVEFHPDFEVFHRRTRLESFGSEMEMVRETRCGGEWEWEFESEDGAETPMVMTPDGGVGMDMAIEVVEEKKKRRQGSAVWDRAEVRGWLGNFE